MKNTDIVKLPSGETCSYNTLSPREKRLMRPLKTRKPKTVRANMQSGLFLSYEDLKDL